MNNNFEKVAANENNPKWKNIISREFSLYTRDNDIRSEFERDYTRILHCTGYRRLKHKTQVFFSPNNDHICTRIEHVSHVESISYTIAKALGLNTELTKAIATAHDIGHSPFGHQGEKILSIICQRDLGCTFWHERNGLELVDNIELLEDNEKNRQNLNLTYAVRDGIISHCGEVDENSIKPRDEFINLDDYQKPNQFAPYTWEGCVVKVSDKISYICRDIEDAITLGILDKELDNLYKLLDFKSGEKINNTIIIFKLITDLCKNSSPEKGLCFSKEALDLMNKIKAFNYKNIYLSKRLMPSNRYFNLVINEIYDTLDEAYDKKNTIEKLDNLSKTYPKLFTDFKNWLLDYTYIPNREQSKLKNKIIFDINNQADYRRSIIYFISGMTDNYAIDSYNEIISF
ncbi:MAG: HD domain-containing protein [Clostridia bacterium]|nr:HD domain-containing protein [Clostridia bacterium]